MVKFSFSNTFKIAVLLIASFSACNTEDFEFDKMAGAVDWKPELFAPIATGSYILDDFINLIDDAESTIQTDNEGLLHIVYLQDSIFSYEASELVEFPTQFSLGNQQFTFSDIDLEDIYISANVSLDLLTQTVPAFAPLASLDGSNEPFPSVSNITAGNYNITNISEFEYITVNSADVALEINNNLPVQFSATIELYDNDNLITVASFSFQDILPGNSASITEAISNISISDNLQTIIRDFSTPGSANELIDLSDDIALNFTFANVAFSAGSIKIPQYSFDEINDEHYFQVGGLSGEEVKVFQSTIKEGTIDITLNSNIAVAGTIEIELISATLNGNPAIFQLNMNGSQTAFNEQIDISGLDIDMTTGSTNDNNTIPYRATIHLTASTGFVQILPSDIIDVSVSINGVMPSYVEGDFGSQIVDIDPGEIDMDIDLWDLVDGSFELSNPQLNLFIENSVGLPLLVNADFTAYNSDGGSADLNPDSMEIAYPESPSEGTVKDTITYDKTNSNIIEFIAISPSEKIEYSGTVQFNPDGPVTAPETNFITDESSILIGLEANLPLELETSLLVIKDTIALDSESISGVDSIGLLLNVNNGIPLDFTITFSFVDTISRTQIGKQFETNKLLAAEINPEGIVTAKTSTSTEFKLDSKDFNNFENANGIAMKIELNSPSQGEVPGRIFADSELDVSIGIKAIVSPEDLMDSNN